MFRANRITYHSFADGGSMSLRVILARLNGTSTDDDVLFGALTTSKFFGGHTVAFFSRPDPRHALMLDEGITTVDYEDVIARAQKEWNAFALNAYQSFERWRAVNSISFLQDPGAETGPSAEWRTPMAHASEAESITRFGCVADILVSAASTVRSDDEGLEAALFQTGRPVLLMPENGGLDAMSGRTVIAWNGSVEASHAVAAAMPFLVRAEQVLVFTAPKGAIQPDAARELVGYLKWHGVRASVLQPEPGGANSVSGALLEAVRKVGATLLVMGAYTHSRVREQFFGGVTRHVLNNADVPVLMAH